MRELFIAFILVTFYSITLNTPPLPEVQAQTKIEAARQPETPKVVKSAEKKKKPVSKPQVQPQVVSRPSVVARPDPVSSGSCVDWIRAAGISDVATAHTLIMKESTCNPNAVNPSSGACGLGQQLPCGKWANQWNDPVGSLEDMNGYVMARYGSWQAALSFHLANNWY